MQLGEGEDRLGLILGEHGDLASLRYVAITIVIPFPCFHTPNPAGFGSGREKSNECWCLRSIHTWTGG